MRLVENLTQVLTVALLESLQVEEDFDVIILNSTSMDITSVVAEIMEMMDSGMSIYDNDDIRTFLETHKIANVTIHLERNFFMSKRVREITGVIRNVTHSLDEFSSESYYVLIVSDKFYHFLLEVGSALISIGNYSQLGDFLSGFGFLYGTATYPSKLILVGESSATYEEYGTKNFYLHAGDREKIGDERYYIMNRSQKLDDIPDTIGIPSNGVEWVVYPLFDEPIKLGGNATVVLYLNLSLIDTLFGVKINASLYDIDGSGKTSLISYNSTRLKPSLLSMGDKPFSIRIENIDHNIERNHSVVLALSLESIISSFIGEPQVLVDSFNYSSYLQLNFEHLDDIHIQLSKGSTAEQKILRSGVATYKFTVSNDGGEDTSVSIYVMPDETRSNKTDEWSIEINGDNTTFYTTTVPKEGNSILTIRIYPPEDVEYNDRLEFTVTADGGRRGYDDFDGIVIVSPDLREFGVRIVSPSDKEVKIGRSFNYTFKIQNTGNDIDDFVVSANSVHGWVESVTPSTLRLSPGEEETVYVTVHVPDGVEPYTEDTLTLTVRSQIKSEDYKSVSVITTAAPLSIADHIEEFFGSIAETVGLDEMLGGYAAWVLFAVFLAVMVLIIGIIVYISTRKYALLICLDRIKEVRPNESTKFSITVKNPTKQVLTYDILLDDKSIPDGWKISMGDKEVRLKPNEEKVIPVSVSATTDVDPEGWVEIKISVIPKEKPRPSRITLMAIAKDAFTKLRIANVFHWPKRFKGGEVVTTKLSVKNEGTVAAKNVTITIEVNGVEKNKVENVAIPPGGYADIKLPWIAYTGRNDIHISVKEG
ncbi:MAG TPA: hypothetical protein ENG74_03345 [Thermoplasmatales archaeon]|nr:hypothetical protein [Thermoplasmatales archaeon]